MLQVKILMIKMYYEVINLIFYFAGENPDNQNVL